MVPMRSAGASATTAAALSIPVQVAEAGRVEAATTKEAAVGPNPGQFLDHGDARRGCRLLVQPAARPSAWDPSSLTLHVSS